MARAAGGGRRAAAPGPPRPTPAEPQHLPGRSAGRLDQLDEHAVAGSRVDERDRSFGTAARRRIDQLQPGDLEAEQRLGEVRDLEADVVEALALRGQEARDAGRLVGRLDQFDLRFADREKGDPDPILVDLHDGLEFEPEHVPPQPERILDRPTISATWCTLPSRRTARGVAIRASRATSDAAYPLDRRRDRLRLAGQTVISSRCSPQATRSRSLISPTVA